MAFDLLSFLLGKSTGSGGGGGSAALGPKTIRQNGVYRAAADNLDGYNTVTVEVPNTYAAADNGKVVSHGALVTQTGRTITENGTFDTTLNNEVVVNVPSAGGYTWDQLIKGTAPSGSISYKPSENLRQYAIMGYPAITRLELDLTDGLYLAYRDTISNNNGLQTLLIRYPESSSHPTGEYCITSNRALTTLVWLGEVTSISNNAFRPNNALTVADFENVTTNGIGQNVFYGCPLKTLILRRKDAIVSLYNINAFTNSSQFRAAGTGGELYVSQSLIESYQANTTWANLLALNANNQILPIEGSIYENAYADGTPIT